MEELCATPLPDVKGMGMDLAWDIRIRSDEVLGRWLPPQRRHPDQGRSDMMSRSALSIWNFRRERVPGYLYPFA